MRSDLLDSDPYADLTARFGRERRRWWWCTLVPLGWWLGLFYSTRQPVYLGAAVGVVLTALFALQLQCRRHLRLLNARYLLLLERLRDYGDLDSVPPAP